MFKKLADEPHRQSMTRTKVRQGLKYDTDKNTTSRGGDTGGTGGDTSPPIFLGGIVLPDNIKNCKLKWIADNN